jgi:hypothetical protein
LVLGLRDLHLGRRRGAARCGPSRTSPSRVAGLPRCAPLRLGSAQANKRSPGRPPARIRRSGRRSSADRQRHR